METSWPGGWPMVDLVDTLHTFDPGGDVLLQLVEERYPADGSAGSEYEPQGPESPADEEPGSLDDALVIEKSPPEPKSYEDSVDLRSPKTTGVESELDQIAHQPNPVKDPQHDKAPAVYLRVSSKHLILASTYFRTMLGPTEYPEGRTLHSEGNVLIPLPDDDSRALAILMYIVHGMTRKVPRHVTLRTLTTLAGLVNYYQLHEAVELFSDTWIANLEEGLPESNLNVVLQWLFISWVFQKGDKFKKMSRILERESDDRLEDGVDESIPIPASIISRIQENRTDAIKRTMEVMHDLIIKYSTSEILCHNDNQFACDAVVLGSLLKGSATIGIWPQPQEPFDGMTFKELASQILEMQVLDDCNQRQGPYYYSGNRHGVKDSIEASIRSLEDQLCGLNLKDFLPKKNKKDKKKKKKKKKGGKTSSI